MEKSTTLRNALRTRVANKASAAAGAWLCLPGAEPARVVATTPGLTWVLIDAEHGAIGDHEMHTAVHQIAGRGPSPIVRLPNYDGWMIKRALDAGAHGIMLPLCNTPEQAKEIVKASKFPPMGARGYGSPYTTAAFPGVGGIEYLKTANDNLLTIVQIETRQAVENAEAIAAVPGIDVLFIGPFDLTISLGETPNEGGWPQVTLDAIDKIYNAARKHNKFTGIFASDGKNAKIWADKGFDMVNTSLDVQILSAGIASQVSQVIGTQGSGVGYGG